jgi:hypothetical protein
VKRGQTVVLVVLACFAAGCSTNSSGNSNSSTTAGQTPEASQITGAQIDCNQFSKGTAQTLEHLVYASKSLRITGVTPFQFYYWVKVRPTTGRNTVVINQSIQGPVKPLLNRSVNGVYSLTAGSCRSNTNTLSQDPHSGSVTITFYASGKAPAPVFIEVNFGTDSLTGIPIPAPQGKAVFQFSVQDVSSAVDLIPD